MAEGDYSDGDCNHGMGAGSCRLCINKAIVYVTDGGECYHRDKSCRGVDAGHDHNRQLGRRCTPLRAVNLGGRETEFRRECSVCGTGTHTGGFGGDSRRSSSTMALAEEAQRAVDRLAIALERVGLRLPRHEIARWLAVPLSEDRIVAVIAAGLTIDDYDGLLANWHGTQDAAAELERQTQIRMGKQVGT